MARLLAGAPGLATSPDQKWLAVAGGGRLSLVDVSTREETAAVHLHGGEADVSFVATLGGLRLVALAHREGATDVRSYLVPSLEEAAQLELVGDARLWCASGDKLLVLTEAGEAARVVTVSPKHLGADPLALREPVQAACPAPDDKFLVLARDQLEIWDPRPRRSDARLNLPVSRPRQMGFAGRRKLLWFSLNVTPGRLEVFRYSDGRLQLRSDFTKRVVAIDGHPDSPRLVAAVRSEDQPPELQELDLSLHDRHSLGDASNVASFCVLEGDRPMLVTVDAEARIKWRELQVPPAVAAMPADQSRRPRQPTPPVVVRHDAEVRRPAGLSAPTHDWRTRLDQTGSGPLQAAAAPDESGSLTAQRRPSPSASRKATAPPQADRDARGTAEPLSRPPRESAPASDDVSADPSLEAAQDSALKAAHASDVSNASGASSESWRTDLSHWGARVLSRPESAAAPPESPPIASVALHLGLDPSATAALCLLYADWLAGDGATGVAASVMARALGAIDGDGAQPGDAHWREALGRGALAAAGLVEARRGRLRLHRDAGRLFDGHPPAGRATRFIDNPSRSGSEQP